MRFSLLLCALAAALAAAPAETMRAGAARIDITPSAPIPLSGYAGRTEPYRGIHDRLYARTIVVDDGGTRAALIVCDLSGISHALWEKLSQRIERETAIPRGHILLSATHTHGGPALGPLTDDDTGEPAAYARELQEKIVSSVQSAIARL